MINEADEDGYLIVFEARDGKEMISKLDKKALPDILILDVNMRGMDGYETAAWLRNHYPEIRILVISMVDSEEAIVRMVRLGVKGYLSKDIEPKDFQNALRDIMQKGFYYTDFFTGKLVHSIVHKNGNSREDTSPQEKWMQLNEREREIIKLICTDKTYAEIARELCLSPKTIDGYRDSLFEKLEVRNRIGLVIYAIKYKLVDI